MSVLWQFNGLVRKNLLTMRRNVCQTFAEILFPILLMILIVGVRKGFKIKKYEFTSKEGNIDNYINYKSVANIDSNTILNNLITPSSDFGLVDLIINKEKIPFPTWKGLTIKPILTICTMNENAQRLQIATIGKSFPIEIKNELMTLIQVTDSQIANEIKFKDFETIEEMEEYVASSSYGLDDEHPKVCFGIFFEQQDSKTFNYSLHYFDSWMDDGIEDVPNGLKDPYDEFQKGPDMESYDLYGWNGYTYIMKIINDYILRKTTGVSTASINFGMTPQLYETYKEDPFGEFVGFIVPFFVVIAYMCPMCLYVFRMVSEKETRAKEGMKIMGMGEGTYFMSYFVQYFIINIIYSLVNAGLVHILFAHIPYIYLLGMFWMFGMDVFVLAFFFQSFIDKTRVALILSLLIYFVMFFMSIAVFDEEVSKSLKMFVSIFPSVALEMGVIVFGEFESKFEDFTSSHVNKNYLNYSISAMYLMFFIDFFIYLFLGYYLQNIISHQFGIKRPFYFLCTKSYWCKSTKRNTKRINEETKQNEKGQNEETPINPNANNPDFQSEELYKDKTKKNDIMKIRDLVKTFDDGKTAVNGVSINLYKDEIFALLGHNGAGKSTIISMLCGLYEATAGEAVYDGVNILDDIQMDIFRTKLGICPQHDVLFGDLTIREHLSMFCYFKGVPSDKIEDEINKTLRDFRIEDIQDIIAKNLSAGQRRKLSIAIAIIGGSEVIFLDEPSSGMDITSRRNLWEILKRCTENKIIILTTHYMEEASVLGNRIGIISEGKMKCIGSPLFLIERFGKFISINITKEPNAENKAIIDFIKQRANNVEYEILSEEILFRIPKNNKNQQNNEKENSLQLSENSQHNSAERNTNEKPQPNHTGTNNNSFSLTSFFKDLDENLSTLKIKSYSAAMPTLEDVFLNVASIEKSKSEAKHRKFSETNESNDNILFEQNFMANYSPNEKFNLDLRSSLYKRLLQIFRDMKSFFLEILCPIILILIGLGVSQVTFIDDSEPIVPDIDYFGKGQTMYYASVGGVTIDNFFISDEHENITASIETIPQKENEYATIVNYMEEIRDKEDQRLFAAVYFSKIDTTNQKYEFVQLLNAQIRQAVCFFTPYYLNQIINYGYQKATGSTDKITIHFTHKAMPLTADLENHTKETNNYTLVFFVNVAFSLIPANFITLIVKERINNSKHLMKISGISLVAYWLSNYIFELIKYYIAGGINMLLIWAFDYFPSYLYVLYLLYGPSMVSFTYLLSFAFSTEAAAQNGVILINFLFGALGSSVVLMFRSLDSMVNVGKGLAFAFRLVPSFAFGYGFNQLLNGALLLVLDNPLTWNTMKTSELMSLKYVGCDSLFMGIETLVYLGIMIIIEKVSYTFKAPPNDKITSDCNDSAVLKEIDRANAEDQITVVDENGKGGKEVYSVRIKNMSKTYSKPGCCVNEKVVGVKNLSFCIEYGECFGLLGINGAGKTTTFKCLTQEHAPSNGSVYINGIDISSRFEEVRHMFGYCPQFDAIFEYMTVYENLEFYANLKGVKKDTLDKMLTAMIAEMSLTPYRNKVSGNLSGGNKRKLSVAISMICNPPIILLDEPSTGMDPEARRFMWAVIHKISTRRKKSSVIMTTHSMDEAETLCRRMGIMVNGEFVCLGSAQSIKEKYGYGFEIDVRIKPLSAAMEQTILNNCKLEKGAKVTQENAQSILDSLGKSKYITELNEERIGKNIIREMKINGSVNISAFLSWCHYVSSAMKMIKQVKEHFDEIILSEYIENNFLFKIKKTGDSKSIGFLFGLVESGKEECNITEYSIQQTSLEQIFNQFAANQGKTKDDNKVEDTKTEIAITKELLDNLAN